MTAPGPAREKRPDERRRRPPTLARPAAGWGWIAAAVIAAHGLIFWAVADKRFLPTAPRSTPAPPQENFAARERKLTDARTGRETAVVREYDVSTRLASPTQTAGTDSPAPSNR